MEIITVLTEPISNAVSSISSRYSNISILNEKLTEINGQLDSTKDVLINSTNKMGEAFEKAKTSLNDMKLFSTGDYSFVDKI